MGGGPVASQSFWLLKKGTRTFNFRLNLPSPRTIIKYDYPRKIKKKTYKIRIRDLFCLKNDKFSHDPTIPYEICLE